MKNALVTGGAGFIGSRLCSSLLNEGCNVTIIDNFSTGKREYIPTGSSVYNLDLTNADDQALRNIIVDHAIDTVFHLAAIHFIPACIKNPQKTFDTNVDATNKLFMAVGNSPVERVVFTSSADVYAVANEAYAETHELRPFNIYGFSKLLNEQIGEYYSRTLPRITVTGLRLFNVYGPNETNPHLLPVILEQLRDNNTVELGNVTPKRDYVFVDDVVRAFIYAAHRQGDFEVYNVGTGQEYAVEEVVGAISQVLNRHITIRQAQERIRKADREHLLSNVEKIERDLGWHWETSFVDGLRKTLESLGLS